VREESHLEDMRAAIRGDFERLKERLGDQELMVAEGDAEATPDPSPAAEGDLGDASPPTLQQSVASEPAADEHDAAAEPEPPESPPEPDVPAAEPADSVGTVDTPEAVAEGSTPALQQTVASEPAEEQPRRSWLDRLLGR
jgi:hypothetical protein